MHRLYTIAVTLLLLLSAACAPAAQPTATPNRPADPLPETFLAWFLDTVPRDLDPYVRSPQFSSMMVWFMDRAGEAEATQQSVPFTISEFEAMSIEGREALLSTYRLLFAFGGGLVPEQAGLGVGNFTKWAKTFAYDPFALRRGLYVGEPLGFKFGVALLEGGYASHPIRERLRGQGYMEKEANFFALSGDEREMHIDSPIRSVSSPSSIMNRVAVAEGAIIAGNNEDLALAIRNGRRDGGRSDSLARAPLIRAMLEELGSVHFAVLFPREALPEAQETIIDYAPFAPPEEWSPIEPYAWAGLAYARDKRDEARLMIVVGYETPDAAAATAEELALRFRTYRPMTFPSPDEGSPRQEAFLIDSCSLDEPVVASGEWGSIVSLTCAYDPQAMGHWWRRLVEVWDLDFLLPQAGQGG